MAKKEPSRRRKPAPPPPKAGARPGKPPARRKAARPPRDAAARPAAPPPPAPSGSAHDAAGPWTPRVAPETWDLGPATVPVLGDLPWGYGENRITVMARDPHTLFAYWEVTDEAIAAARARLGDPGAACALRVYDTTYRLFDGANANWWLDVPVERHAREHYLAVNRPDTTFHVDVGVRGWSGAFATIARSGAVDTPRDAIAQDGPVEWMTVEPAEFPRAEYRHRFVPRAGAPPGIPAPPGDLERVMSALVGEGWVRTEWTEAVMGGRVVRWLSWSGPLRVGEWRLVQVGPTTHLEFVFGGERRIVPLEHGEEVVVGPWHVTIAGLDVWGEHRILGRWTIHYAWTTGGAVTHAETPAILWRILGGYRASGRVAGSEALWLQEAWASEALALGASEWAWGAASELRLAGASEAWLLGAGGLAFLGASERAWLGASELAFVGASELGFAGASELAGASERRLGAAGEARGGASESLFSWRAAPGASEALGGASDAGRWADGGEAGR